MVAPLLKWPGGKTRELPAILAALPDDLGRLVDPFVGGGAVVFALPASVPAVVNDASADLVALYRGAQSGSVVAPAAAFADWWDGLGTLVETHGGALVEGFLAGADVDPATTVERAAGRLGPLVAPVRDTIPSAWGRLTDVIEDDLRRLVPPKLGRMRRVEARRGHRLPVADVWANVEGAVRAAVYTRLRADYNTGRRAGDTSNAQTVRFLFLREYAYAAMFRFNRHGDFNVPYGGITYNRKPFADRVAHLASTAVADRLATTAVACGDFADFLDTVALRPDDVVFLDPPYDSDFSAYDRRGFGPDDHARLATTIRSLPCRFQLVVKDTPLVRRLYCDPAWHVQAFDHTYAWTIKDRNDRRATHLLITDVDPARAVAG